MICSLTGGEEESWRGRSLRNREYYKSGIPFLGKVDEYHTSCGETYSSHTYLFCTSIPLLALHEIESNHGTVQLISGMTKYSLLRALSLLLPC